MKIKRFGISAAIGVVAAVCTRWILSEDRTTLRTPMVVMPRGNPVEEVDAQGRGPSRLPSIVRVRQKDLSPTDGRYDAVRLLDEADGQLTMAEVYEAEPRDLVFAPILEKRMQVTAARVLKDLGLADTVTTKSISCKTLSCIATFSVATSNAADAYAVLGGVPFAEVRGPELQLSETDSDVSEISFKLFFPANQREEAAFRAWQDSTLWPRIALLLRLQNEASR